MQVQLDAEDLREVIEAVVPVVLRQIEADAAKLTGKLAYSEPQAEAGK